MTIFSQLSSSINSIEKVSLPSLDTVSLLNRIDSKYVVSKSQLEIIFPFLEKEYFILDIDGFRVFNYENNYFDTPDLLFYKDHHNGYAHRMKVRSRKYVESNLCYFEIKRKINLDRTQKSREGIPDILTDINEDRLRRIQENTRKRIEAIQLILKNNFNRITLVDKQFTERVTIDSNLTFIDMDKKINFDDVAIIEIKQSKRKGSDDKLTSFLKRIHVREQSFSKYIYGVLSLSPSVKKNNFLPLIKKINNLSS